MQPAGTERTGAGQLTSVPSGAPVPAACTHGRSAPLGSSGTFPETVAVDGALLLQPDRPAASRSIERDVQRAGPGRPGKSVTRSNPEIGGPETTFHPINP